MKNNNINKIVSNYLMHGANFCISSIRCSNMLYKIEVDGNSPLVIKVFNNKSNFIREKIAFKLLRSNNIKVPTMLDFGEIGSKYWILYEFVKGVSLCNINIKDINIDNIFYDIGYNLASVHNLNSNSMFSQSEIISYIKRRFDKFIQGADSYKKLLVIKYPTHAKVFEMAHEIIDSKKSLFLESSDFKLIICDFSPSNIIIDSHYKLAAFIDFEHFMFENRYRDFILIYDHLWINKVSVESFAKGYSEIINENEFVISYDKLNLFLLHNRLENCVIADKKKIQGSVRQLIETIKFSNHNA